MSAVTNRPHFVHDPHNNGDWIYSFAIPAEEPYLLVEPGPTILIRCDWCEGVKDGTITERFVTGKGKETGTEPNADKS